jgi:hypothetical protein
MIHRPTGLRLYAKCHYAEYHDAECRIHVSLKLHLYVWLFPSASAKEFSAFIILFWTGHTKMDPVH